MAAQSHRIQEATILSPVDGSALYSELHKPERSDGGLFGTVVLVHGFAEHLGRYAHVCKNLVEKGYQVLAYDHRGHGRSSGIRCHVNNFDDYAIDFSSVLKRAENEGLPVYVLAHSMGALITLWYWTVLAAKKVEPVALQSTALIGVPLKPQVEIPQIKRVMGLFLSKFFPKMSFKQEVDARFLARNAKVGEAYMNDPLVAKTVTTGWFQAFTQAIQELPQKLKEANAPAFFLHGADDKVAHPDGSRVAYEIYPDPRKQLHIYEGCYHELLNEDCYPEILAEIHNWFQNGSKAVHETPALKAQK